MRLEGLMSPLSRTMMIKMSGHCNEGIKKEVAGLRLSTRKGFGIGGFYRTAYYTILPYLALHSVSIRWHPLDHRESQDLKKKANKLDTQAGGNDFINTRTQATCTVGGCQELSRHVGQGVMDRLSLPCIDWPFGVHVRDTRHTCTLQYNVAARQRMLHDLYW